MKRKCRCKEFIITVLFALVLIIAPIATANSKETLMLDDAQSIAQRAYVWGFPIVMNYKTMYSYAIDKNNPDYKGPFNEVACEARLFTPADKAVVTPNADTPYCMYWMDVRAEPVVLSAPEMEPERFYHFQLVDLYTHNFAYIGTLTSGNGAGSFLIAGPDWKEETPEGITGVIRSESGLVFNVVRTQLFGPDDLEKVKNIQAGYGLQLLSEYAKTDAPPAKPMPELPAWDEGAQFDGRFFYYLNLMMGFLEKPAKGDEALWADLARLGIGTGDSFDFATLPTETQKALEAGVKEGFAEIEAFVAKNSSDPQMSAKLFGTRAFLEESAKKNFQLDRVDLLRSAAAHTGLYGNSGSEAIYPAYFTDAEGKPLDASANSYTITFKKDALPPVKSFWSLTMYDGKTQLFIENQLERYVLNSTMAEQFTYADDGSLILYISKESPGPDLEPNWLPAPDGPFYAVMRLYGPEKEALEGGSWSLPPLVNASSSQKSAVEPSAAASGEFSVEEIDNLVRRTYPYVAMFNVINKGAMMEENPTRTGWNGTYAATGLLDHTSKSHCAPQQRHALHHHHHGPEERAGHRLLPGLRLDVRGSLEISAYDHYVDIPLTTTKGDFEEPAKVLYHTERTPGYDGGPVEGVDRIIEMTGDFAIAFLRVMPHAAEPERLEKNLVAMKLVEAVDCPNILGSQRSRLRQRTFRTTTPTRAFTRRISWRLCSSS